MNRNLIKRIVAFILLGALVLGLLPMIALATETGPLEVIGASGSAPAASVGVIGGADGPTAIFVTGSPVGLVVMLAVLICAGFLLIKVIRKRKA